MDSDRLRNKGNELYKQIQEGERSLAPMILRMRLTAAQQFYSQAAALATTADQRASAFKNSACLFLLWAQIELSLHLSSTPGKRKPDPNLEHTGADPLQPIRDKLATSVDFFSKARAVGLGAKPQEWLHGLDRKLTELVKWAAVEDPSRDFIFLRTVCKRLEKGGTTSEAACVANMDLADILFKEGVCYFNSSEQYHAKDYRACLRYMNDCYSTLNRAECIFRFCQESSSADHSKGISDMQGQVRFYTKLCESLQAIEEGDGLMKQAIHEDVSINMDFSLLAMDKYRDAINLYREAANIAKGKDVEIEAIAMSKIGKAYTINMNMPTNGLKYHSQATALALTIMSPRIARSDWYAYSWDKAKQCQETRNADHTKEREEATKKIMLKLADKIKELKKKYIELHAKLFLEFLYKEHPHPNPEYSLGTLNDDNDAEIREAVRGAILQYHPDSNVNYGLEWVVMCTEITKFLNNKYEDLNRKMSSSP